MYRGEVMFFKRPESLYDDNEKRIKINDLENIENPKDSGHERFGLVTGTFKGQTLLCEDSIVFKDKLMYSVVTKTN